MGFSGRCKNWISYPFVGWILNVHDCTVKVHADVIFFPKKFTAHVHLMPAPTTGTFLINCEGVKYGCSGIRYAASSQWWQRESRIGSAEQGIATLTEEIAAVEINIKNLDKAATEVINQRKGEHKEFLEQMASYTAAKEHMQRNQERTHDKKQCSSLRSLQSASTSFLLVQKVHSLSTVKMSSMFSLETWGDLKDSIQHPCSKPLWRTER